LFSTRDTVAAETPARFAMILTFATDLPSERDGYETVSVTTYTGFSRRQIRIFVLRWGISLRERNRIFYRYLAIFSTWREKYQVVAV
jgi:hypothetical protein